MQVIQAPTRFLGSQNPALMKRTVLASFTDVLLLPVTIVPRAVGAGVGAVGAIGTGVGAAIGTSVGAVGTGVVQGIAMLNPQRWVGNNSGGGRGVGGRDGGEGLGDGYESFGKDGALFEVGEDEDEREDVDADAEDGGAIGGGMENEAGWGEVAESRTSRNGVASAGVSDGRFDASDAASTKTTTTSAKDPSHSAEPHHSSTPPSARSRAPVEALDLLLSLDVSLELIHATRDATKRLETFAGYPGTTGTRVRETLDEAFCEMLGALGTRHIAQGFGTSVRDPHCVPLIPLC